LILEYVDDSGDSGLDDKSPTRYFVLTTMIVYEQSWNDTFHKIKEFRKELKKEYKINLQDELKANYLFRKQGFAHRLNLSENTRVEIYKKVIKFISTLNSVRIFSVCIKKREIKKRDMDIFSYAWKMLITRQHYTANKLNREIGRNDKAILISDDTNEDVVRKILRQLRIFNYVNGKNFPVDTFIDDPFMRKSHHSYFIQLCDMVAFCVAAKNISSKSVAPYEFQEMYKLLDPVIEKSVYHKEPIEGIAYFP
jgi:Protein of unknown function (DUF3800)